MSERVTAEQVQACLDIVDVYSIEYLAGHFEPDEQVDEEFVQYCFKLPTARMPQFVISQMIMPPFPDMRQDDYFDLSIKKTTPLSNDHLLHDEALIVSFMQGFQSSTIHSTTALHYALGFPDAEGDVTTRVDADITACTRDHERERHQQALERVMYHSQLDVRLKNEGLPLSVKPSEHADAAAYLQYVHDNNISMRSTGESIHVMDFLGGDEKDLIHEGAPMDRLQADMVCTFLGSLSVRDRLRTGYEALAERFGTETDL